MTKEIEASGEYAPIPGARHTIQNMKTPLDPELAGKNSLFLESEHNNAFLHPRNSTQPTDPPSLEEEPKRLPRRFKNRSGVRVYEIDRAPKSTLNKMNHALAKLKNTNQYLKKQNNEFFEFSNQHLASLNMKLVRFVGDDRSYE